MNDPSRRVGALLNAVPGLEAIYVQLEAAAGLQRVLRETLPPALAGHVQLVRCDAGTALLVASGSAAAARLRMLAPRLTQALRAADSRVREIRIVVDVARQREKVTDSARRLDATGMAAWRQLANSLPTGPLREACRRLSGLAESDCQQQPLENEKGHDHGHDE